MSVYDAVMTTTTRSVTATGDVIVRLASSAVRTTNVVDLGLQAVEAHAERLVYASQQALATDKVQAADNAKRSLAKGDLSMHQSYLEIAKSRIAIKIQLDADPDLYLEYCTIAGLDPLPTKSS